MRRPALLILVLTMMPALCCRAQSEPRRVSFGVEWGYSPVFYYNYKYVYRDDYGTTVLDKGQDVCFDSNAFILARVGLRLGEKSEVSLLSGYCGIATGRKAVPLLLRYNYASGGSGRDGLLVFADGGVGLWAGESPPVLCNLGAGRRVVLDDKLHLDFTAGLRASLDHPLGDSGLRNDRFSAGIVLGVELGF